MFNKVILMGRLVADPELRQTPNGIPVCAFRIAVNRRFAGKDKERQADFIDIVAWRNQAEFVSRFFTKGRPILVEGTLQSRSYEDKSGQKRYVVEVVADALYFTESKGGSGNTGFSSPSHHAGGGQAFGTASGAFPSMDSAAPSPSPAYSNGDADDFSQSALDSDDFPF